MLSVLLLCSVFTGCDELDRMKNAHAVKKENGNILLNGNEYKYVPLASRTSLFNFDLVASSEIYVTEPDVPVLLSESCYEHYGDVSEDGKYLYIYKAVEQVMLSVEPVQLDDYSEYDADDYIYIYECSEDLIFNRMVMTLEVKNGRYAVATDIGGGITEVRRVPDELFGVFQKIMAHNYYYTSDYEALVEEEI